MEDHPQQQHKSARRKKHSLPLNYYLFHSTTTRMHSTNTSEKPSVIAKHRINIFPLDFSLKILFPE